MKIVRSIAVFFLLLLFLSTPSMVFAYDLEATIEKSMISSLVSAGLNDTTAHRIARQYMFMGTVMISKAQFASVDEDEALSAEAERTAAALGLALANAYTVYGDSGLHEVATVMMHSVRAGVGAEAAAETFAALANNGYAFDASISMLHKVSETVRTLRSSEAAQALCENLRKLASENTSVGDIENEIRIAVRNEKIKHEKMLALKDAERRKRDSSGGSGRDDRGTGGSSSSGGGGSSSAAGARGGDSSNSAGGSSGGNDSSNSSSGNDSSGSDSSGNDGGSSGGNDNSSSDGGDSGGSDSSGNDSDSNGSDNDSSGNDNDASGDDNSLGSDSDTK